MSMDEHAFFNINYYIVWSTKYRRKVLNRDIERRLKEILIDVGKQKGFEIAETKVGTIGSISLEAIRQYIQNQEKE